MKTRDKNHAIRQRLQHSLAEAERNREHFEERVAFWSRRERAALTGLLEIEHMGAGPVWPAWQEN